MEDHIAATPADEQPGSEQLAKAEALNDADFAFDDWGKDASESPTGGLTSIEMDAGEGSAENGSLLGALPTGGQPVNEQPAIAEGLIEADFAFDESPKGASPKTVAGEDAKVDGTLLEAPVVDQV